MLSSRSLVSGTLIDTELGPISLDSCRVACLVACPPACFCRQEWRLNGDQKHARLKPVVENGLGFCL
jgi:hypothetical protein